jgi:hypothetical protein
MEVKILGRGALDARGRASEFPARTRNISSRGSSVFNYGLVYTSLKIKNFSRFFISTCILALNIDENKNLITELVF